MNEPVWISGLGVNSAIGMNLAENLDSLLSGRSGVGYPDMLETLHRTDLPVCEIKQTNEELAARCRMRPDLPRTTFLSALAAEEALADAGIYPAESPYRIGFISANTLGGMDRSEHFYADFLRDHAAGHLQQVVHHECGSITELVAQHLGIKHYVTTLSTACSSSANALIQGSRLLKHNKLDIALVGGADALCRFTLNGFNTLMILDSQPCKPFDENRKGLNLGEGAGYVVLISDRVKRETNARVYAQVSGYANANDAFHQTASSPEGHGNYLAMSQALAMSGLNPTEIAYINAHGTGTANNDSSEGLAIMRLFGEQVPPLSTTKGYTGHTLGACGGIEAVYCCLAMTHGVLFPCLRVDTPITEHTFQPLTTLQQDLTIRHAMSNSFGFGGNCTSLILSKAN